MKVLKLAKKWGAIAFVAFATVKGGVKTYQRGGAKLYH